MSASEITLMWRLWFLSILALLAITQQVYHRDTIGAIRAVGIQCNAEYRIILPKNEIEEIN